MAPYFAPVTIDSLKNMRLRTEYSRADVDKIIEIIIGLLKKINEKDEELRSRNAMLRSKDEIIRSKDQELRSRNNMLRCKDEIIRSKDQQLRSREEQLRLMDDRLNSRNDRLRMKEEQLCSKTETILLKDDQLIYKNIQLHNLQKQIINYQKTIEDLNSDQRSFTLEARKLGEKLLSLGENSAGIQNDRNLDVLPFLPL